MKSETTLQLAAICGRVNSNLFSLKENVKIIFPSLVCTHTFSEKNLTTTRESFFFETSKKMLSIFISPRRFFEFPSLSHFERRKKSVRKLKKLSFPLTCCFFNSVKMSINEFGWQLIDGHVGNYFKRKITWFLIIHVRKTAETAHVWQRVHNL